MKIISDIPDVQIGPVNKLVTYYDRSQTRVWWAYLTDAQGNQIGEAKNAHRREDAVSALGFQAQLLDLPPTLLLAYNRLFFKKAKSASDLGISLETLRSLVKRGVAQDVTPPGPAPQRMNTRVARDHFKFIKVTA